MREVELAGAGTERPPRLEEPAGAVELHDARVAVAVGELDLTVFAEGDVRRLVEEPVGLCPRVLAPEHEQDAAFAVELEDEVVAVVRRPDVVVLIDPQAVRVIEEPLAEAAEELPAAVEFDEHRLRPVEQEDVPLRVQRTPDASPKFIPGGSWKKSGATR